MWVFTQYGFFSVVEDYRDKTHVVVRARHKQHLESLKKRFTLDRSITSSTHTDYPFRICVPRDTWSLIMYFMALEINYTNFKNHALSMEKKRRIEGRYVDLLHEIWVAVRKAYES